MKIVFVLLVLLAGSPDLFSQGGVAAPSASVPAFRQNIDFILAEAEHAFIERNYDRAAAAYQSALRLRFPLPEAEYGIARILHAEGLRDAAERKYRAALAERAHLRNSELVYQIQYDLAELYLEENSLFKYQDALESISAAHDEYRNPALVANMKRVLYQRGMDRLFALYRFDSYFALAAHAELGEHYVRSGNYSTALEHLAFAFVMRATQLAEVSRAHILDIDALSYSELFARAHALSPILNTLNASGYDLYRLLFYLGAALYGDNPSNRRWSEVWSLIADVESDSPWVARARARLEAPRVEQLYS